MAGYNYKYQMSNNAVDAYKSGCKPYDQWTKGDLMNEIQKLFDPARHTFDVNALVNEPVEVIRMAVLSYSAWHHTTRKYQETDFYFVDGKKLLALSDKTIQKYHDYVLNK